MPNTTDFPIDTAIKHCQTNTYDGPINQIPAARGRLPPTCPGTAHPRIFRYTVPSAFQQWRCVLLLFERQCRFIDLRTENGAFLLSCGWSWWVRWVSYRTVRERRSSMVRCALGEFDKIRIPPVVTYLRAARCIVVCAFLFGWGSQKRETQFCFVWCPRFNSVCSSPELIRR